jgi:hypothetical protein
VVRGEAGIGQRCRIDGIRVAQRHEVASGNGHVVGHAAVASQTDAHVGVRRGVLAVGVLTAGAGAAVLAAHGTVDQVRVALREALDAFAHFLDPPGVLMPHHERGLLCAWSALLEVVVDGDIGVAGSGSRDLEEDLAGSGGGLLDVSERREGLEVLEHDCAHGTSFRREIRRKPAVHLSL